MRKTTTLALTLTVALTIAAPIYAAPAGRPRERAEAVEMVKKWVKRVFEIITVPIP
ncbi:MAG TPA: hypothetical protein VF698_16050 [Thermoanaerobaculia bacterium]|jgi:hypothetical protein